MNSGHSTIVLAGLESAGKSALFRGLTGYASGDEANFRGSTVVCRKCRVQGCTCDVVDTPGIRSQSDAQTTQLALEAAKDADIILLVVRGTNASQEIETLLSELDLKHRRSALAITFKDKAPTEIETLASRYRKALGVPVVLINARSLDASARAEIIQAIEQATSLNSDSIASIPVVPTVLPKSTIFEHVTWGRWMALMLMVAMFAVPVYLSYLFSAWAQPLVDQWLITPVTTTLAWLPTFPQALLTGGYGILTLGWYSFLWAFPVVLLLAVSVALAEETGLKDRITAALDPWLRRIGLNGRDLIPVLTAYGCNVVAVFQSRACSSCTRKSCVSLISFGSACSYQIGASLSIFAASGYPSLFVPYLTALFLAGVLHTRLWHGAVAGAKTQPLPERAFLQLPSMRAIGWRIKAALKQFLSQAMPIFLLICIIAAGLEYTGALRWLEIAMEPLMAWIRLPNEAAGAILFSILRKDGLLTLNRDEGSLLAIMSGSQIFLVVWLASTSTACLVTLWTIRKELGWQFAFKVAGRQMLTSVATSLLIVVWI